MLYILYIQTPTGEVWSTQKKNPKPSLYPRLQDMCFCYW